MPRRLISIGDEKALLDIASYARRGPGRRDHLSREEIELIDRTVRRTPEVMVKVLSRGGQDLKAVGRHFAYLDRAGEVEIETGRTHQIRVHSAHIEHPIAGDEKYGDKVFNRAMREKGLKRLFLHAARFEFSIGERTYGFSAPLPDDLKRVLDALSLRRPGEGRDPASR